MVLSRTEPEVRLRTDEEGAAAAFEHYLADHQTRSQSTTLIDAIES